MFVSTCFLVLSSGDHWLHYRINSILSGSIEISIKEISIKMWCFVSFLLLLIQLFTGSLNVAETLKLHRRPFVSLYEWTELELDFPTADHLKEALVRGYYDSSKLVPVDLDVEYGDDDHHRVFLTIPRLHVSVPYSLAVIAEQEDGSRFNPRLIPYPSYDWHSNREGNCSGITSAIRIAIDECWRLWVVDSGQINAVQHCPAQILAFDLVNDALVHQHTLSGNVYTSGVSVFTALAVDVGKEKPKNECRDTMLYIADPWGFGLIVYNAKSGRSWRIEHRLMQPDGDLQTTNASNDGIFTVSLDAKHIPERDRYLYFHALNSYIEVSVPLRIVNNYSLWLPDNNLTQQNRLSAAEEFRVLGSRGTQCESETMDNAGNLYCSLISSNALITWMHGSDYHSDKLRVVAYNPEQLNFVTGLKVNRNTAEEDELWALSSDPKLFVGGRVKTGNIKFRVIGCRTKNLLNSQECTVQAKKNNVEGIRT